MHDVAHCCIKTHVRAHALHFPQCFDRLVKHLHSAMGSCSLHFGIDTDKGSSRLYHGTVNGQLRTVI